MASQVLNISKDTTGKLFLSLITHMVKDLFLISSEFPVFQFLSTVFYQHCVSSTVYLTKFCLRFCLLVLFSLFCFGLFCFNTLLLDVVDSRKILMATFTFQGWTIPVLSASPCTSCVAAPLHFDGLLLYSLQVVSVFFCTVEPRMDTVLHMQSSGTKKKGIITSFHLLKEN